MKKRNLSVIFLLVFVFSFHQTVFANTTPNAFAESRIFYFEKFFRTELYFGTGKPDGTAVSEAEWNKFLADEVTPRFPKGFTVLDGFGQYQGENEKIVREKSFCLILLYVKKDRRASSEKIEQIRESYKKIFQQESVLRLDFRQTIQVSF
jgi:hypothetical protein